MSGRRTLSTADASVEESVGIPFIAINSGFTSHMKPRIGREQTATSMRDGPGLVPSPHHQVQEGDDEQRHQNATTSATAVQPQRPKSGVSACAPGLVMARGEGAHGDTAAIRQGSASSAEFRMAARPAAVPARSSSRCCHDDISANSTATKNGSGRR